MYVHYKHLLTYVSNLADREMPFFQEKQRAASIFFLAFSFKRFALVNVLSWSTRELFHKRENWLGINKFGTTAIAFSSVKLKFRPNLFH